MPKTVWGRKETVIWPRHMPIYTYAVALGIALLTFVGEMAGVLDGLDVFFYAVVAVVDTIFAIHWTRGIVVGFVTAAGRWVVEIDRVIIFVIESGTAVESLGGEGRVFFFLLWLTATSKGILLLGVPRRAP